MLSRRKRSKVMRNFDDAGFHNRNLLDETGPIGMADNKPMPPDRQRDAP